MAKGLPDFQIPINITAQDLAELNVDIVAQTLGNLAVNIAAQTLATLGVNIKAQDLASLAVDITTQTLAALKINITAQDLSELVINIAAQTVGVYLQPEWAAKTGVDKDLYGQNLNAASGTTFTLVDYTVTNGKKLYISHFGACVGAAEKSLLAWICSPNTITFLAITGGMVGVFASLNKPIVIAQNVHVYLRVTHNAGLATDIRGHIGGYEV